MYRDTVSILSLIPGSPLLRHLLVAKIMHDGHPKVVLYGFTNMCVRFGDVGSHPVHYMGGPNFLYPTFQ